MDIRTLIINLIFVNFSLGLLLLGFSRLQKVYPGFKQLAYSNILTAFMHIFFSLRGLIHDYITIILPNILVFIIVYYKITGLKKFLNEKNKFENHLRVFILFSSIFTIYFTIINDSALNRNIMLSLYGMSFSLYFAFKFVTSSMKNYVFIKVIGTTVSLLYFTIVLLRIITWFEDSSIHHLLSSSLFNALYFLLTSVINIVWAGLFLLISTIRQNNELNTQKDKEIQLLRELATRDPLTKLFNRNRTEEFLNQQIQNKIMKNTPASVAIIDIDNFKLINDNFGHNIGDKVLIEFSNILRQFSCDDCLIARWGGEEFLIVYPNMTLINAAQNSELLRKSIQSFTFSSGKSETASFGVAEYKNSESLNAWLNRADKNLYIAKEKSKNRVEF